MKRFYKVDKSRVNNNSFGIGLSIANRIANNYNTKIYIESELDKYTIIRVYLTWLEDKMKRLKLATVITIISISLIGCSNSEVLNNKKVTIDEAKEIALKHAGLTSDQVSFVEVESDVDNNIEKYNIEFYHGDKEYDYEINSANGEIIKYDYNMEYDKNENNVNSVVNISEEQAKEIALNHAEITSDKVSFIKVEMDVDNGTQKYDIEFYYNNIEYNYEIDANTGDILSYERD